ncbi:hypothetical protein MZF30_24065 [Escherichia coli]|nr:hypothetical protein [Escherichia coli]
MDNGIDWFFNFLYVKVERQAFIDAMVMTGVSRQDAEKRFLDYVKNKGRG